MKITVEQDQTVPPLLKLELTAEERTTLRARHKMQLQIGDMELNIYVSNPKMSLFESTRTNDPDTGFHISGSSLRIALRVEHVDKGVSASAFMDHVRFEDSQVRTVWTLPALRAFLHVMGELGTQALAAPDTWHALSTHLQRAATAQQRSQ